jgi:8-oxo-dGTP diphosphatase
MEKKFRNPVPTVDIIIQAVHPESGERGIILIERKNPPFGWALPGGFVDYGETVEQAAVREAKEETCLDVRLIRQFHVYSDPARDSRLHTITTVFIAEADGTPHGADDAVRAEIFIPPALPGQIAFDHASIIEDFITRKY